MYTTPEVLFIAIEAEDVLTGSNDTPDDEL